METSYMKEFRFEIEQEYDGTRIDRYISDNIDSLTRSYLQKMIKEGCVTANGKPVKPSYSLKAGDQIAFTLPESIEPNIEAEDISLDIIYEDEDLLIVNKPKDMVVHPAAGHYTGTLVNAVMFHCKGNLSGINGVMRPGIVHRIDKDTSGSLIICKNDLAHNGIAEQLKDHSIKRIYHAIVYGELTEDGTVDKPIGRDPKDRLKMAVVPNGKSAVTHFHVLKQLKGYTYISCRLETGRTHQIRVHMASIGHPILGDDVYASGRKTSIKCQGQTLHAKTIGFTHPRTGEYMEFDTELPQYFQHLLKILE